MRAGAIRGEAETADGAGKAGATAGEDVKVAPLVVVMARPHEAPVLQVRRRHPSAGGVAEGGTDLGVSAGLDARSGPKIDGVDTLIRGLLKKRYPQNR